MPKRNIYTNLKEKYKRRGGCVFHITPQGPTWHIMHAYMPGNTSMPKQPVGWLVLAECGFARENLNVSNKAHADSGVLARAHSPPHTSYPADSPREQCHLLQHLNADALLRALELLL
jgi:hypothetical protein